jgi:RHS repeat-associated protein
MRPISVVLLAAFAASAFGTYTWYFTDPMQSLQTAYWASSGSPQFTNINGYWGGYSGSSSGGVSSMVSTVAVPDGTSSYGVRATLRFANGNINGSMYLLLRANTTFNSNSALPTNAYAVNYFCSGTEGWVQIYKLLNGVATSLASTSAASCSDGMTVRAEVNDSGNIYAFMNDAYVTQAQDSSITSGAPGLALSWNSQPGNAMLVSQVQLGPADRIAPGPIPTNGLTYSVYSNHIDFQWQAVPDDTNGTGVQLYQFLRDDQWAQNTTSLSWSDTTVQPGVEYSYTFEVQDYFFNTVSMTVNITVPPLAGSPPTPPDGRRVGVRSTGAYWGASTEQIDVLSGNLNYTIPMLKAQARTGWGAGFSLNYNSQNWRVDSGGTWNLGEDVGYGYGWKLLAGSLTPVWANQYTLSYYGFVDSTGAEYRLTQNNSGIWTSLESVYVFFNANTNTLYFRDGTYWVMGSTSADTVDLGTMYPTTMEDTNGNQIFITYLAGGGQGGSGSQCGNQIGLGAKNSSARIALIQDVRGSYVFCYNADSPNHLTSITSGVGTAESYTFSYGSLSLQSPFSPYAGAGTVSALNTVVFSTTSQQHSFVYSSDNSGALAQAYLPNGGALRWAYQNVTYGNGATYREVSQRQLSKTGESFTTYPITYGSSPGYSTNQSTTITDAGGVGQKYWAFSQTGANTGMVTTYQGQQLPGPVTKTQNAFTWNQDNLGNLYIGSTLTTLDPGQSYQAQKRTDQTVDINGNVLKVFQFDYNSLTTPARIYTYTYLNSSAYTAKYIFNRMTQATLAVGAFNAVTLATTSYDSSIYNGGAFTSVPTNPSPPNWDTSYSTVAVRGDVTGSTSINDVSNYAYDQAGNVTIANKNGITTTVTLSTAAFYAAPSQLSVGSLTSSMDWSSFLGPTSATGPNGDTSTIGYDSSARPLSSTSPYGATTAYTYSSGPNNTGNPATSTATTNGRWTKTIMDGLGRPITVQTGNGSTVVSQTDTVYGSCGCSPTGKMLQQSLPHAPNATVAWTTYTYDGIGRTLSVIAPDGASTTTYSYQGNTVTVTDPAGKWKIFTMDAFGHLTKVDEPNPGSRTVPLQPVSPPTFSPAPGTYGASQTVTLSSTTSGASIRYTTNGTTPTETTGELYTGAFSVSSSETVNAIAYITGMADSAVMSVTYTISTGGSGPAWYNNGWSYRKAITIAHGQVSGSSNLTNFPMAVAWASDANLASAAQSSGNDILFTLSDGVTKLNHEIEQYTSSSGKLAAWVQIPTLSYTTDTVIYMYYGNGSAGNQQQATNTWNSNYQGVWHLAEASGATAPDSTANGNNASSFFYNAPTQGSGQLGSGQVYASSNYDANQTPTISGVASSTKATLSGWYKKTSTSAWVSFGNDTGAANMLCFTFEPTTAYVAMGNMYASLSTTNDTNWHYLSIVFDATQSTQATQFVVYIDGVQKTLSFVGSNPSAVGSSAIYIGNDHNNGVWSDASIDEVRISNAALSPGWVSTEYNNQHSPGTFYSVGSQQGQGSGSYPTPVSMPTFSPAPGVYDSSVTVTLSSSTSGASIRYTTNGTTPSETAGTLYTGAFTISSTTTVKAIAYATSMADSEIPTVTFTISSSSGGSDYITTYTYDAWDNMNQVSMPRPSGTQTRSFSYHGKLLQSATNPENGTVFYTYNAYNKVATKTDAKGQATKYTYDGYARLTQVQRYPTGGISGTEDTCQQENYFYDSSFNNNYTNYSYGRLTKVQYYGGFACNTTFTETYGYSQAGEKTNKGLVLTRNSSTVVDLEATYAYDTEGRMTTIQYPGGGPNYSYAYDTMGRLNTMTNVGTSTQMVTGTTYDPANRLLSISGNVLSETREYNTMGQLRNITSTAYGYPGGNVNITYNYSATQNNGKITSQTDNISAEQVVYAYDALNRLASAVATSGSWGQSYNYDGFGNLTDQIVTAGTAPTLSVVYNASNNLQSTDCADANGNILAQSGGLYTCSNMPTSLEYNYDVANRMHPPIQNGVGTFYSYAPGNKRVWRGTYNGSAYTLDEVTFWSVNGQKIETYNLLSGVATYNSYFGGRLISNNTGNVATDRLGSVGKYYPWGQEKPSATTNGTEKFTGYFRDAETGLDYADQRYHQPGMGRFLTTDPSTPSDPKEPDSWNLYSYTQGDPVNFVDPNGLSACGDIPIDGGVFNGQTLSQVMQGKTGYDLMAQLVYNEAGAITNADIASNFTGYVQELDGIGTAILNEWDVDDGRITVIGSNGQPVCPLGSCAHRTLFQILTATSFASDSSGNLFDANGNIRQSSRSRIDGVLNGSDQAGVPVWDNGVQIGSNCEGIVAAVAATSNLITGATPRYSPNGLTILFWNMASPDSTSTFPGSQGYTGVKDNRPGGHTFWGLPAGPKRRPPGRPR